MTKPFTTQQYRADNALSVTGTRITFAARENRVATPVTAQWTFDRKAGFVERIRTQAARPHSAVSSRPTFLWQLYVTTPEPHEIISQISGVNIPCALQHAERLNRTRPKSAQR